MSMMNINSNFFKKYKFLLLLLLLIKLLILIVIFIQLKNFSETDILELEDINLIKNNSLNKEEKEVTSLIKKNIKEEEDKKKKIINFLNLNQKFIKKFCLNLVRNELNFFGYKHFRTITNFLEECFIYLEEKHQKILGIAEDIEELIKKRKQIQDVVFGVMDYDINRLGKTKDFKLKDDLNKKEFNLSNNFTSKKISFFYQFFHIFIAENLEKNCFVNIESNQDSFHNEILLEDKILRYNSFTEEEKRQQLIRNWKQDRDSILLIIKNVSSSDISDLYSSNKEIIKNDTILFSLWKNLRNWYMIPYEIYYLPKEFILVKKLNIFRNIILLSEVENLNDLKKFDYNELKKKLNNLNNLNNFCLRKINYYNENNSSNSNNMSMSSVSKDNVINNQVIILDKLSSTIVGKLTILLDYAIYYFNNRAEILEELEKNNINISAKCLDIFFNFILDFFRTIQFLSIFSKVSVLRLVDSFREGNFSIVLNYIIIYKVFMDIIINKPELFDNLLSLIRDIKEILAKEQFERILCEYIFENKENIIPYTEEIKKKIKELSEFIYDNNNTNLVSVLSKLNKENIIRNLTNIDIYFISDELNKLYFLKLWNSSFYLNYNLFFSLFEDIPKKYPKILQDDLMLRHILIFLENNWRLDLLFREKTKVKDILIEPIDLISLDNVFCDKNKKYFNFCHPWIIKRAIILLDDNTFIDQQFYHSYIGDLYFDIVSDWKVLSIFNSCDKYNSRYHYIIYIKDMFKYLSLKKEIDKDLSILRKEPEEINLIKFLERYEGIITFGFSLCPSIEEIDKEPIKNYLVLKFDNNYFHNYYYDILIDKDLGYEFNDLDIQEVIEEEIMYYDSDFQKRKVFLKNIINSQEQNEKNIIKYRIFSSLLHHVDLEYDFNNLKILHELISKNNKKFFFLDLCPISNSISNFCYNEDYHKHISSINKSADRFILYNNYLESYYNFQNNKYK